MDKPIITHKTCTTCKENKEVQQFDRNTAHKTGFRSHCKDCGKLRREQMKTKERPLTRKCSRCKEEKPTAMFSAGGGAYGLHHQCRACAAVSFKERSTKAKITPTEKVCIACKCRRPILDFYRDAYTKDGHGANCKTCSNKRQRKKKLRAEMSPESLANLREYMTTYIRNRSASDIGFAVERKLRAAVATALNRDKRKKLRKADKTESYFGCAIDGVRAHLESLFSPGMTWDNHGVRGWHVDHIRPIASFDKSDPDWAHAACHYTNLQPLWATDNLAKADKWDPQPSE